jgi:hypothetical protein
MAREQLHSDAVEHQIDFERGRGHLRSVMAGESVRSFWLVVENSRRPMMGSLRFNYTVRASARSSSPANVHAESCTRVRLVALELPSDASGRTASNLLFQIIKYKSQSGLSMLSTRMKSPKDAALAGH